MTDRNYNGAPEDAAVKGKVRRQKKEKVKRPLWWEIGSWVLTLLSAVVIAMALRTCLFEFVKVDGESMMDTLSNGEIMLVGKTGFSGAWVTMPFTSDEAREDAPKITLFGDPARFEPVICRYPDRGTTNFVKRVVGLPGDMVELKDGWLYIDGVKQDEAYVNDSYRSGSANTMEAVRVPKKGDTLTFDGNEFLVNGAEYSYGYAKVMLSGEAKSIRLLHSGFANAFMLKTASETYITDGTTWLRVVPQATENSRRFTYYNNQQSITEIQVETLTEAPLQAQDFTVAEDSYFVMGDHRNNSRDSRWVGALPRSYLMGGVRSVIWPIGSWRGVE